MDIISLWMRREIRNVEATYATWNICGTAPLWQSDAKKSQWCLRSHIPASSAECIFFTTRLSPHVRRKSTVYTAGNFLGLGLKPSWLLCANGGRMGWERVDVLNVAEKPSVAKEVSALMTGGNYRNGVTQSRFNPVHQFQYRVQERDCSMVFTSVRGHLMSLEFASGYQNWNSTPPEELYSGRQEG
ncbi:dna topoisomerase family protein [Cystoisospora suis]|uniref:DNA topoisomerase n=1 Tax=Cystoisospora suis TaxID=483139 RepID=A0A2C6KJM6_9APIC|nr:dna topoisomerase family protein [Cystoisospora suis]